MQNNQLNKQRTHAERATSNQFINHKITRRQTNKLLTLSKLEDKLGRWKEHFQKVINRSPPTNPQNLEPGPTLNINVEGIAIAGAATAKRHPKNEKSGGVDNILVPQETLKCMDNFPISYLHRLLNRIWNEECIQEDWHAQRTPRKATKKRNFSV